MEIAKEALQEPVRKLKKAIRHLSKSPSAEEVHEFRTLSRRLEAGAIALQLDRRKRTRQFLNDVAALRKSAGKVRDLDVLTAKAGTLSGDGMSGSLVQLIDHLGTKRIERAEDFYESAVDRREQLLRELKRYSKLIRSEADNTEFDEQGITVAGEISGKTVASAVELTNELRHFPELGPKSIHIFRIKAKLLRYILQLQDAADPEMLRALGEVKDQIGDWHDWSELAKTSKKVLDPETDGALLTQVQETELEKLKMAVKGANALRDRYLISEVSRGARKPPRSVGLVHLTTESVA